MKKTLNYFFVLLISASAMAQFPGGGGMMRGGGGGQDQDLKGRSNGQGTPGMQQQEPLEKGPNRVSGTIVDSVSGKAVEFANLALYKKEDLKKPVEGGMTDDFGKFTIKGLPDGEYVLKISFLGYEPKSVPIPKLAKGAREYKNGNLLLAPSTKLLNEVTITGQKSLLEDKVDRLVYNAEVDKTVSGGNAGDVLRKVPMLQVDLEGNLSMRGSSNITVLINNKPSTIMASSIADALKQIPAEMIKTVEVITSPSAKYDAEGTSGIINIITKKNNLQGLTGQMNTSAGNRGTNLFGGLNYKQGKLSQSINGGGNAFYNRAAFNNIQDVKSSLGLVKTVQDGSSRDNGLFGNVQYSADYELNKYNSLTFSTRYGRRGFNSNQTISSESFIGDISRNQFDRMVLNKNQNQNVDVNLDYTRTFAKPQKEFSILTQISQSLGDNGFNADIQNAGGEILSRQRNVNETQNREATIQIDLNNPIKKNQIFEIGGKGISRKISNDFAYYLGDLVGVYKPDANFPASGFGINQNIAGAYSSYTVSTPKKFSTKLGVRYEYTDNLGEFNDGSKVNILSYGNLIPSIQMSKKISGGSTIKATYNKRIQRPSMRFLSPNVNRSNPQDISTGNPELSPELTDAFELNFSTFKKANSLNVSLFNRYTVDAITQVRTVQEGGVIYSKFENIGKETSYGVNLFGSTRITQKWQLNLGSNAYYAFLENPTTNQSNGGWVVDGNYFLMGQLGKGWGLQSFGFIRGRRVQLQGSQAGFFTTNLAAKKDFTRKNGNKGSFGLGLDNPWNVNGIKLKSTFSSTNLEQTNTRTLFNFGLRGQFSYQFGKMTFGGKQKKSVNNDDTKQDDSGNQGGGASVGGARGPR